MYYLAVVGSREFWDKTSLFAKIDEVIKVLNLPVTLVSGGARGADSFAAEYAKKHSINIIEYLPDWSIGKHAGFIRNRKIIEKADYVIACLVDTLPCNGTKNSIAIARELNKPVFIINSKPKPTVNRKPHIIKNK